jgi:hypothetical protein
MGMENALFFTILTGTKGQDEKPGLQRSFEIMKKTHGKNGSVCQ